MKINKLFTTIITSALLLVITGCSGLNTPVQTSDKGKQTPYTLSGKLAFDSSARTATSSFSKISSLAVFFITAQQGETSATGTVNLQNSSASYQITFPKAGEWTLTVDCSILSTKVYSGSTTITISENATSLPDKNIELFPVQNATATGDISLAISSASDNLTKITWKWLNRPVILGSPAQDLTRTITKQEPASFDFTDVPTGTHNIELDFYNSSDKLLYSCREAITVFNAMITDTWTGTNPYLQETSGQSTFVYSDNLSDSFEEPVEPISVSTGTTPYVLWSCHEKEDDSLNPNQNISNKIGSQVFSQINGGETITSRLDIGSNYCFVDDILYAPPYRYIPSYYGYARDSSFDLSCSYAACTYLDGYLYIVIDSYGDYYLARYDIENGTALISDIYFSEPVSSLIVQHGDTENSGLVYFISSNSYWDNFQECEVTTSSINRTPFLIEYGDAEDPSDDCIRIISDTSLLNPGETVIAQPIALAIDYTFLDAEGIAFGNFEVNDIQLVDDVLYVILSASSGVSECYIKEGDVYTAVDYYIAVNNGGILKFDASETARQESDFVLLNWNSPSTAASNNKILGLYLTQSAVSYYTYSYNPKMQMGTYSELPDCFMQQPPLENADSYFYGPRKFVATQQGKLIFADDGGFIAYENSVETGYPKNRIVTIDLATEDISVVDVNATFSAYYNYDKHLFTTVVD